MFKKKTNIFFSKKKLKENRGVIKLLAIFNWNIFLLGSEMILGKFDKQHVLHLWRIILQSFICITEEYLPKTLNTNKGS